MAVPDVRPHLGLGVGAVIEPYWWPLLLIAALGLGAALATGVVP